MNLGKPVLCSLLVAGLLCMPGNTLAQDFFDDLIHSDLLQPVPTGPPKDRVQVRGNTGM